MTSIDERLQKNTELVNEALKECFSPLSEDTALKNSIRYSLLAPGKRFRPHLVLEFYKLFGTEPEKALPYACAVEAIHTYSLIHDDLPCMDNDDLRRGRPTNHKVYGEAMALLAGDALLTYAFELLAGNKRTAPLDNVRAVKLLADKAGYLGMVGGQEEDILNESIAITSAQLDSINDKKTGALLEAACGLGCIAAGVNDEVLADAMTYGLNFGAAFQIIDDILDVTASEEELGKPSGSDEKNQKTTYVAILGMDGARRRAEELTEIAVSAIEKYAGSEYLVDFARTSLNRTH